MTSTGGPDEGRTEAARDHRRRLVGRVVAVAAFVVMLALPPPEGLTSDSWRVAAAGTLLAVLWLTEAIPVAATALLPLVVFPLLGIASIDETAAPYANPIIFLFLGGFLIGLAMERSNLHRRIALSVLSRVGAREDRQIAGFMLATAVLSMWVSNTATAVMMLPVALSIVPRDADGSIAPDRRRFAVALLLAVAYGANIGGVATLIGTPPNALLAAFMHDAYGVTIGFAQWMLVGVPLAGLMLVLCWFLLTRMLFRVGQSESKSARDELRRTLADLGSRSPAEKRVAIVFIATATLWIMRPLAARLLPQLALSDTVIAMAGALLLFVIPSGRARGDYLLSWRYAERLPWGVLLLFGGGLSLAAAVSDSGLAQAIGDGLRSLDTWPVLLIVIVVTVVIIFLTELTSNTATAATFLPVVAALAASLDLDPMLLAIPAALAASFAFMLPVATPPNAIVFGSGHIRIQEMARAGIWLNILGTAAIVIAAFLLVPLVFGV